MENISILERNNVTGTFLNSNSKDLSNQLERSGSNPVVESLLSEGNEDFSNYLHWLGLAKEPNLMVLSSIHHYYYEIDDLKEIKTLINLEKLNHFRHLDSFLQTIFRLLPPKSYFLGCFKESNPKGINVAFYNSSKLFNGLMNIIDSKADMRMSGKEVVKLMEEHGFKVIDVTEINGLTYFCSQNRKRSEESSSVLRGTLSYNPLLSLHNIPPTPRAIACGTLL